MISKRRENRNQVSFISYKIYYYFIVVLQSPCSKLPCKNSGKCVTLYETNSYVCVCNNGFTGKHCEMGKDIKMTTLRLQK